MRDDVTDFLTHVARHRARMLDNGEFRDPHLTPEKIDVQAKVQNPEDELDPDMIPQDDDQFHRTYIGAEYGPSGKKELQTKIDKLQKEIEAAEKSKNFTQANQVRQRRQELLTEFHRKGFSFDDDAQVSIRPLITKPRSPVHRPTNPAEAEQRQMRAATSVHQEDGYPGDGDKSRITKEAKFTYQNAQREAREHKRSGGEDGEQEYWKYIGHYNAAKSEAGEPIHSSFPNWLRR